MSSPTVTSDAAKLSNTASRGVPNNTTDSASVAFLADIHGNYTALKAVLDDLPSHVEEIVYLGDLVGIGPRPQKVVETVQETADVVIQGDFDRHITNPDHFVHAPTIRQTIEYSLEQLTTNAIAWLQNLPTRDIYRENILLSHSHPDPNLLGTYIQHNDLHALEPYFNLYNTDIIAFAHTHIQAVDRLTDSAGELVFNPGSVGHPRDRNPNASYAVLDPFTHEIELRRVPYDQSTTSDKIIDAGLPEKITTWIENGK